MTDGKLRDIEALVGGRGAEVVIWQTVFVFDKERWT